MTLEMGFLWLAELLMIGALGCFVVAFRWRKRNLARHRSWAATGIAIVFGGLLVLEVLMRGLGWQMPVRDRDALHAHLVVATISTVVLIALGITGALRIRSIHVKLYWLFFPSFVATIVLSWFAFQFFPVAA
jgi:hypothetical protein